MVVAKVLICPGLSAKQGCQGVQGQRQELVAMAAEPSKNALPHSNTVRLRKPAKR